MGTTNTNDPIEVTKLLVREALDSHFKGPNRIKRLQSATDDVVSAITHLIKTSPISDKKKLGATVMTESASMRNPHTGKHGAAPRNL